ncbi:MAG TPA: F0F1 ATP synthase subunit B [Pirellulaceae bacterium]
MLRSSLMLAVWAVVVLLAGPCGNLRAQEQPPRAGEVASPEDVHGATNSASHDAGGAGHGAHHDPYDKSAANATRKLEDMTELRSDLGIATVLVFTVLMLILWKFAWGPISQALDHREEGIAKQIAEARQSNEEAKRILDEHQSRLRQAAEEVRELLDQARRDGDNLKQKMVQDAEQVATSLKDRAVREIEAATHGALEDLARKSVEQAVSLAGRIVGKQLNAQDHANLIQEALQRMPSRN